MYPHATAPVQSERERVRSPPVRSPPVHPVWDPLSSPILYTPEVSPLARVHAQAGGTGKKACVYSTDNGTRVACFDTPLMIHALALRGTGRRVVLYCGMFGGMVHIYDVTAKLPLVCRYVEITVTYDLGEVYL